MIEKASKLERLGDIEHLMKLIKVLAKFYVEGSR